MTDITKWNNEISTRNPQATARERITDMVLDFETLHALQADMRMGVLALLLLPVFGLATWLASPWAAALLYLGAFGAPILIYFRERDNVSRHVLTRLGLVEAELQKLTTGKR